MHPQLEELDLESCPGVTPEFLQFLQSSQFNLKRLCLSGCRISKEAIQSLRTALPELEVVKDSVFQRIPKEMILQIAQAAQSSKLAVPFVTDSARIQILIPIISVHIVQLIHKGNVFYWVIF